MIRQDIFRNKYFVPALLFFAGTIGGLLIGASDQRYCADYTYINADYACGGKRVVSKGGYLVLENNLRGLIQEEISHKAIDSASIYFRDLRGGPTLGVSADEHFIPASLLKLPLILAYFSIEEETPGLLQVKLLYQSDKIPSSEVPTGIALNYSQGLTEGKTYTVKEIMKSTIVYSDNLAYYLLLDYLNNRPNGTQKILRTFQELGIIDPRNITEEVVSTRGYASLFRMLYNVSYLNAPDSEEVLDWLSQSVFAEGLQAGIPKDIPLANKFGTRELDDMKTQLHDCGIVYYPKNPYILCVMTRGKDINELARIIATVSKLVYQEVNARRL